MARIAVKRSLLWGFSLFPIAFSLPGRLLVNTEADDQLRGILDYDAPQQVPQAAVEAEDVLLARAVTVVRR